jgi:hypothetical protein
VIVRKLFLQAPAIVLCLLSVALIVAGLIRTGRTADSPSGASAAQSPRDVEAEMVRRNGAIFEGWPPPKLALVFTGLQDGYIEPCGCSGKENQKGGLSRRDMLLKRLRDQNWPLVLLDVGEQVRRYGRQQELKYSATADALNTMSYQAIGFGPDDLRLSTNELLAAVSPVTEKPSPFVAANVDLLGAGIPSPFRVIEAGGKRIGVTSVIGDEYRKAVNNQDVKFKPADAALKELIPKLAAEKCDLLVLLSNATKNESIALAKKFPQFNIVMTAGSAEEPPKSAEIVAGTKTMLIELGPKSMYAIVLGIYDDKEPIRYQRVPLDARFGDSEQMKKAMTAYQDQLKELGLSGLGIKASSHSRGRQFVGSQECKDCHTKAYDVWKKTPHASALATLEHLDPPRQFDPECLSCHVTGWEPQKFFPFTGGYVSIEKTPQLGGNGCENCHGPGSAHVAAETGQTKASPAELEKLRKEMHLTLATQADRRHVIDICLQCHDIDNSIEFKGGEAFDKYWLKVEHHGKD